MAHWGLLPPPQKNISALLSLHFTNLHLRLGLSSYIPECKTTCQNLDLFPSSDENVQRLVLSFCPTESYFLFENCSLLGSGSGNSLPTFRDNLLVPTTGAKNPYIFRLSSPEDGANWLSRNVSKELPLLAS